MIKFVKAKGFQKIKKDTRSNSKKPNIWKPSKKVITAIWIFFAILIFFGGVRYIVYATILAPNYTIKKVKYDATSTQAFDDPYLYNAITTGIKLENYYLFKFKKNHLLGDIQSKFPIVKNMKISYLKPNTVGVTLSFNRPQLLIKTSNLTFGLYQENIFQIYSGNTIGSGTYKIDLPGYISGTNNTGSLNNLAGLFFEISAKDFVDKVNIVYQSFEHMDRIVFLPGAQRIMVQLPKQTIYINIIKDIKIQLKNLTLLQKYYPQYKALTEIDLGSLDDDKIIVKK